MMKTLAGTTLLETLPQSIRHDAQIQAVAKALDAELAALTGETKLPLHLPRLDELPENVLDLLAEQYHVDFYEPERMPPDLKRRLIKTSLLQHMKFGTKYAVEKLLSFLTSRVELKEWFEYGGEPYHFKLKLKELRDLDDDGERIIRAINIAKNLRSWLDNFDFDLSKEPPDEILHVAFVIMQLGKHYFDLDTHFDDKHFLAVYFQNFNTGKLFYDSPIKHKKLTPLRAGFINLQCGVIKFKTSIDEGDELWYRLWRQWLKWRWRSWNDAEIIYYSPEEPLEPELPDDENFEGDFLRLWLSYHNDDSTRILRLPYPRDDLTGADINAVNVDGLFINRRGFLSDKIIRATLVKKSVVRMYF